MPLIVGLTGGIASGKTTVANLFQQHFSIDIVDADIIARDVVAQGTKGLTAIVEHFGPDILHRDGSLNRTALRERIFTDATEKNWLNQLLHPLINQKMSEELQKVTSPYALLVVPLLIENQLQSMVDRILVIDVDEQTQIERTQARDKVSKEQVLAILSAQASRTERLAFADDVIENSSQNQRLLPQITKLHKKYLAISSTNRSE
ncbi:dephospho-CoA kinase [Vibrio cincinnatiensis]|uniref:dephospho-CoA kinase n=1 Tax=Vibrio cincinnatiensis TaxID=675 RepID=UPI001EDFE37F|nr:dephospho-CoA kinase [Vibrio cincinnatiensis]MCG3724513.1 dephospho-CoA kinase [Vibrio cincinnatiensis]MCG3759075.1 dephospho-CoA kinase [Vibrio cincinnatiensis]MCG3762700.1 dephospho-CoA kinase [Vibrio cincinnatiensis]